jgi:hypothetical protein
MVDATISRVRLRDLAVWAAPGTPGLPPNGGIPYAPSAPRRRSLTDAASIGEPPPTRPRVASSRPGTGDLVASTI